MPFAVKVMLFLLLAAGGYGEEIPEYLRFFNKDTITVNIAARIVEQGGGSIWTAENSKATLSGRAVKVRLSGDNLLIYADITPYIRQDGSIVLFAKGEVWVSEQKEGVRYFSTMKSIPVSPGEPVIFFPLGVAMDEVQNVYSIELEIQVLTQDNGDQ